MRLLIAGGGTGGHLFPAIAVAKEFIKCDEKNEVLFVGTKRGLEKRVLGIEGFSFKSVSALPLAGKGVFAKLKSLFILPFSLIQSMLIIRRFKPDFALGVGGYSAGPVIMGAKIMGVSTGVQEQNIVPGMTNKILGKFVDYIFLAFKEAQMFFEKGIVCITGNPIRQSLFQVDTKKAYEVFRLDEDKFTVLVFGGSLGAESINKAFTQNLDKFNGIMEKVQIVHQTGEKNFEGVKEHYDNSTVKAFVAPFIFNMQDAYEVADIIVCRAGATSISEIAALGKAAVLVPYPHAAADHQTKNAQSLEAQNAAMMIKDEDLDTSLMNILSELYENRDRLKELRDNIGAQAKADAAKEIVRIVIESVAGKVKNVS